MIFQCFLPILFQSRLLSIDVKFSVSFEQNVIIPAIQGSFFNIYYKLICLLNEILDPYFNISFV